MSHVIDPLPEPCDDDDADRLTDGFQDQPEWVRDESTRPNDRDHRQ